MKKFITFIAVLITMAAATSCNEPVFNKTLNQDYARFKVEHPDGVFYESHIILSKNLEDVASVKKLNVVACESVFQDSVFCHIVNRDFVAETRTEETIEDLWLGSCSIVPTELVLTLEEALAAYEASEYETTGNKVTLRSPVGPEQIPPYYIIGQQNSPRFVTVNALTGEVGLIR